MSVCSFLEVAVWAHLVWPIRESKIVVWAHSIWQIREQCWSANQSEIRVGLQTNQRAGLVCWPIREQVVSDWPNKVQFWLTNQRTGIVWLTNRRAGLVCRPFREQGWSADQSEFLFEFHHVVQQNMLYNEGHTTVVVCQSVWLLFCQSDCWSVNLSAYSSVWLSFSRV